ncbi:site-specific integrase [Klebsiella pneumoniae]|uniref:site-specific integrase n=1 Tax=Klebsiella pneumoniae TaxID=573 RepID=UPI00115EAF1D|nr:site-specific integrase [Klebsiella pneumoniae]
MLVRYVEWLNAQCRPDGKPWTKSGMAGPYSALRKLLQWTERCRPGVLATIEYPFNPFPWRNRDAARRGKMPARELRAVLRACEADIARIRAGRQSALVQRGIDGDTPGSLGWLLEYIDDHCGGIVPTARQLSQAGWHPVERALARFGGLKQVEPCLYPRAELLVPYYLAILIHAAGNPDPIAELGRDCLQPLPLLDDRQALVWFKARSNSIQRRAFSSHDNLEPPALVKEIMQWNERLVRLAPTELRDRLFIYKGVRGVVCLTSSAVKQMLKAFCQRHGLRHFSLASIRPGVLTSFYRVSGDLRRASAVANHANLATTVRYVQTPEVQAQNQIHIAGLQNAFIGHIERNGANASKPVAGGSAGISVPGGRAISMFGFDCRDPFSGTAPGSPRGELCTHFMGCFTCPNAIITSQPSTLARLIQARDHLRAAARKLHPARWQAIYEPQLRVLEEDILPRFAATELADAEPLLAELPPLAELR